MTAVALEWIAPVITGAAGLIVGRLGTHWRRSESRETETREAARARRAEGSAQAKQALQDLEAFTFQARSVSQGPIRADNPELRIALNSCELIPDEAVRNLAVQVSLTVTYWDLAWMSGARAVADFWAENARRHALEATGYLRSGLQEYARGEDVSESVRKQATQAQQDATKAWDDALAARRPHDA